MRYESIRNIKKECVPGTINYLREFHRSRNLESGFAADKKILGWNILQKRDDRIDNAPFRTGAWHNMFNTGKS